MKLDFEDSDLERLALKVAEKLKPLVQSKVTGQDGDKILTVGTLAQYLGVKKSWIYEKVHLKGIPHFKVGKFPRFRKADIDSWLQSSYTPAVNGISNYIRGGVEK